MLCMGKTNQYPISAWKKKIESFMNSSQCRELYRIDGEPMEFEWKIPPDSPHNRLSSRSRKSWLKYSEYLSSPQDESFSCQCMQWRCVERQREKTDCVLRIPKPLQDMQEDSRTDVSRAWGHDDQLQWRRTSCAPWVQCFRKRILAKQRRWNIVCALLWWYRCSRSGSSHDSFRQSARCLRSSSGYVWRTGLEDFCFFQKVQGDL